MRKILLCIVFVVFCAALLLSGCTRKSGPTGKSLGQGYGPINTADDPDFHPEKSAVEEPSEKAEEPVLSTFMQNSPFGEDGAVIFDIDEQYAPDAQGWSIACSNGRYGWLDGRGNVAVNFVFEEAYDFDDQDMALVKKDGYYGWIDRAGNIAIAFQFTYAQSFISGTDNAYAGIDRIGVIDRQGNFIIPPKYSIIHRLGDYYEASTNDHIYELYKKDGLQLFSYDDDFSSYDIVENLIYAHASSGTPAWCILYDSDGNNLLQQGTFAELSASRISFPCNGMSFLRCETPVMDPNIYYILNDKLEVLGPALYAVTEYSASGYAAVRLYNFDNIYDGGDWYVVNTDANAEYILPLKSPNDNYLTYSYANATCAIARSMGDIYYVVNSSTDEMTSWSGAEGVDGTECIIVYDKATNLYGLYDGTELVLNNYENITFEGTTIYLHRGGSETQYVPSDGKLSDSSAS